MSNEYDDFIQSLVQNKEKHLLMTHKPSDVQYCKKYFDGYLAEEELQERQFTGRYWALKTTTYAMLFVILDNDTVLCIARNSKESYTEVVRSRNGVLCSLPDTLRGMYYPE